MSEDVKVPAVDVVLADKLGVVGLLYSSFEPLALADEFAADVDVAVMRGHGAAGDEAALDQQMRIVAHDLPVLAGAGLGLVGIDHEVMRSVHLLGHERPLQSSGKTGAPAAALTRRFHFVDDAVAALLQNRLGAIPGTARPSGFELPAVMAVEVLEDAVLVGEHSTSLAPGRSTDRSMWSGHRPALSSAGRSEVLASAFCRQTYHRGFW